MKQARGRLAARFEMIWIIADLAGPFDEGDERFGRTPTHPDVPDRSVRRESLSAGMRAKAPAADTDTGRGFLRSARLDATSPGPEIAGDQFPFRFIGER